MKLEFNKNLKTFQVNQEDEVIISNNIPYAYTILVERLGYASKNVKHDKLDISKENLDLYFEVVEDFTSMYYNGDLKKFKVYHPVYKSKKHNYFIHIDHDLERVWEISKEQVSDVLYALDTIYYKSNDINSCTEATKELEELCVNHKDSSNKISLVLRVGNNTIFKEHRITPLDVDIDKMYNDDFKTVHEHVIKNLTEGKKGVFLFHGAAGTGKTNYIKNLTRLVPEKKFVFVPVGVIPHLADPSFIGLLIDNKGSVLVLEDCENFIKDRGQSGSNVVSTILNLSDGILSDVLGIQIICTFNADIGKIDEALRRKGRLIDEYEFGKLKLEKGKKLGESIGVEVTKEMTLSEIYNAKDESNRVEVERKSIGFGR